MKILILLLVLTNTLLAQESTIIKIDEDFLDKNLTNSEKINNCGNIKNVYSSYPYKENACKSCCLILDKVKGYSNDTFVESYVFESWKSQNCQCKHSKTKVVGKDLISDTDLQAFATKFNLGTLGTSANEYEELKKRCSVEIKSRSTRDVLRDSPDFTEDIAKANLPVFNLLLQFASSPTFPRDTCLDYKINGPKSIQLSFGFKGSFTSGTTRKTGLSDDMAEIKKIGDMFNKIVSFPLRSTDKLTNVTDLFIRGFADHEFYAAAKKMEYVDTDGTTKSQYYSKANGGLLASSTNADDGLLEQVLKAKSDTNYVHTVELDSLIESLTGKHMKYLGTNSEDQKKYISEVEVNQLLAFHRAVQAKRALKTSFEDFDSPLNRTVNSFSSCRNLIAHKSEFKTDTNKGSDYKDLTAITLDKCDKRRSTVIEAIINSYGSYIPATKASAEKYENHQHPINIGTSILSTLVVENSCMVSLNNNNRIEYTTNRAEKSTELIRAKRLLYLTGDTNHSLFGTPHATLKSKSSPYFKNSSSIISVLLENKTTTDETKYSLDNFNKKLNEFKNYTGKNGNTNLNIPDDIVSLKYNGPTTLAKLMTKTFLKNQFRLITPPAKLETNLKEWTYYQTFSPSDVQSKTNINSIAFLFHKRIFYKFTCDFYTKFKENKESLGATYNKIKQSLDESKLTSIFSGDLAQFTAASKINNRITYNSMIKVKENECLIELPYFNDSWDETCIRGNANPGSENTTPGTEAEILYPNFYFGKTKGSSDKDEYKLTKVDLAELVKAINSTYTIETAVKKVNGVLCKSKTSEYHKPNLNENKDCK